jgi:hypothetical protein
MQASHNADMPSICCHTSAYVSIRQHTSADVSTNTSVHYLHARVEERAGSMQAPHNPDMPPICCHMQRSPPLAIDSIYARAMSYQRCDDEFVTSAYIRHHTSGIRRIRQHTSAYYLRRRVRDQAPQQPRGRAAYVWRPRGGSRQRPAAAAPPLHPHLLLLHSPTAPRQAPTLSPRALPANLTSLQTRRRWLPTRTCCDTSAYVSIRQRTSAYVSIRPQMIFHSYLLRYLRIRQHTSAYVSIRQHTSAYVRIRPHMASHSYFLRYVSVRQRTSAYVSIRQHTSAYVKHTSENVCIRQAYVCIRLHTSAYTSAYVSYCFALVLAAILRAHRMLTYARVC